MKTDSIMKTNYNVLIVTFVINIFMALSLNSFTSPETYLSAMFLYFLAGFATFIDKITFYQHIGYKLEKRVSQLCLYICAFAVCICIANSLQYIEIVFNSDKGIYKVIMQGGKNAFFTFNSINITPFIFVFAFIIPISYFILCIISYLREKDVTKDLIFDILKNYKLKFILLLTISIISGYIGVSICHLKYKYSSQEYGQPQYLKYFILFFSLFISISYVLLFRHYIKQISESKNSNEINSDSTIKD